LPSKLLLHELVQLIGIKLLTYGFQEFFWFLVPISRGGETAHAPVRTPMPKMSHGASLVLNFSQVNTCDVTHFNYISFLTK